MGRKVNKVKYTLDSNGIKEVPLEDIKAILGEVDDLIMSGGRTLLAKILKGSKEKKVLELQINQSPVYGYFKDLNTSKILARIDWCIENDYLAI